MITPEWVRVPVEVVSIVPYGIGSAKITRDGDIEITLPSGNTWGRHIQELIREGKVTGLTLEPIASETLEFSGENPSERV